MTPRSVLLWRLAPLLSAIVGLPAGAAGVEVAGRVQMPEICTPTISPAVVRLEPLDAPAAPARPADGTGSAAADDADAIRFIDQRGLRFEPRVVAMRLGQALRFGNADAEVHNVQIQGAGAAFNRSVRPGETVEFVPGEPGVLVVFCNVHPHMRAFAVVGASPWIARCDPSGDFRFRAVPEGRYRLTAWHEMGAPVVEEVEVRGRAVDLGTFVTRAGLNPDTAQDRAAICETGCEPWPLVIDRIGMTLAASLEAAGDAGRAAAAVPLAQDAFYRDFETSGMGTAVRVHLGRDRAAAIEALFHEITDTTRAVADGTARPASLAGPSRRALVQLGRAAEALNRAGITERSEIYAATSPAFWVADEPAGGPRGGGVADAPGAARSALLREGLRLALLLGILFALATRSGRPGLLRDLRVGIGLAALAGIATAALGWIGDPAASDSARMHLVGLASLAGGIVLLCLAADLGRRLAARGRVAAGPDGPDRLGGALGGLAAFLGVYRAGAELSGALPALLDASSPIEGFATVAALVAGLALLAGIPTLARSMGRRRAPRAAPGLAVGMLLALALWDGGSGVVALKAGRGLAPNGVEAMGRGLPWLGLYPDVQAMTLQTAWLILAVVVALTLAVAAARRAPGTGGIPR